MPKPVAIGRPATYQDVLDAPEHLIAEIIDGELVLSPRPALPHASASSAMGADLIGQFGRRRSKGEPGGWWILDEPELHLGRHVLVPDLAGWRRERLPEVPAAPYLELAPDWVCEVLSPRTVRWDRMRKMDIYAAHGVGHAWLVDPEARLLEVYRRMDGSWLRAQAFAGPAVVRAEPFDAAELDLAEWWLPEPDEPAPPAPSTEGDEEPSVR